MLKVNQQNPVIQKFYQNILGLQECHQFHQIGAPHGLNSWKTPVDYFIDSNPKKTDSKGGNIVDPMLEENNFLQTTNKEVLNMFQGVRVLLDRPAHVLSELDLRKLGIAINDAAVKYNFLLLFPTKEFKCVFKN